MVSPLHRDGSARQGAVAHDGAALRQARTRKERTCPEVAGEGGKARLVVLAAEVGGPLVRRNRGVPLITYLGQSSRGSPT